MENFCADSRRIVAAVILDPFQCFLSRSRNRLLARNNHLPRVVIRGAWRIVHSSPSYRFGECKADWRGLQQPDSLATPASASGLPDHDPAAPNRPTTTGHESDNTGANQRTTPAECRADTSPF